MAYLVPHYTPEATALRVSVGERTLAFSGDTGWTEALIELADGVDLLVCNVFGFDTPGSDALDYRTLQKHRYQLGCKRLILSHIGSAMQDHLTEVTEEIATDGLTIVF